MKTTFLRLGHANNSSSSHSIIFSNEDLENDEWTDFGWDFFTVSSREAKRNYIFFCLKDCFLDSLGLTFNRDYDSSFKSLDLRFDTENLKRKMLNRFLSNFKDAPEGLNPDIYVDHQSAIVFPLSREKNVISVEFAGEFIDYFLNNSFIVLGGNNNTGESHEFLRFDMREEEKSFKDLWGFFKDNHNQVVCKKDNKTGEWVLKSQNGPILKFKF